MTEKALLGRKVRALSRLRNALGTVGEGTVLIIRRKHAGFSLETQPCATCGIQITFTKVHPGKVELI